MLCGGKGLGVVWGHVVGDTSTEKEARRGVRQSDRPQLASDVTEDFHFQAPE